MQKQLDRYIDLAFKQSPQVYLNEIKRLKAEAQMKQEAFDMLVYKFKNREEAESPSRENPEVRSKSSPPAAGRRNLTHKQREQDRKKSAASPTNVGTIPLLVPGAGGANSRKESRNVFRKMFYMNKSAEDKSHSTKSSREEVQNPNNGERKKSPSLKRRSLAANYQSIRKSGNYKAGSMAISDRRKLRREKFQLRNSIPTGFDERSPPLENAQQFGSNNGSPKHGQETTGGAVIPAVRQSVASKSQKKYKHTSNSERDHYYMYRKSSPNPTQKARNTISKQLSPKSNNQKKDWLQQTHQAATLSEFGSLTPVPMRSVSPTKKQSKLKAPNGTTLLNNFLQGVGSPGMPKQKKQTNQN